MANSPSLRIVNPEDPEQPLGREVDLDEGQDHAITFDDNGVARIEHSDGSVTFDEKPDRDDDDDDESDFYRNLADDIDEEELTLIGSELLTGIELDIASRKDWLDTRATGIRLLGLRLEEPRGDLGTASAPLEGMSTIRHPLLLEATIRFQATARGELLPAAGPVKVRNDLPARPDVPTPPAPPPPPPGAPPAPGAPPPGAAAPPAFPPPPPGAPPIVPSPPMMPEMPPPEPEGQAMDDLGAALEKDMNHYLTVDAPEYVPDTDRMLFYIGFGGDGFKKVYNCPLRNRPVSESVDAEDMIVSNAATDLRNCGRVTQRIKMRPSVLKRMQIIKAYRDVHIGPPNPSAEVTAPEKEKALIAGHQPSPQRPKDAEYEVYECYCELDIEKFAPKQFKDKALPLPYVVTLEKESREVLAVRRNWDEDDEQALPKQFFVQFPFIRGLGFYGLGLIHLLGNVTMALTAIWRIMLDNGMFANFPGFLFAKGAGRQNTNQIRVPPGGGYPVDVPPGMRIQDAFMPLPYKETGTAFMQMAQHIEEVGQRLGQTADLNIGEGKQDVPVGTTMALIEQATKIMDSVHKRLHAAQAEEFCLLKERFRENPEAFWRHNKKPSRQWTEEQFKQALDQHELVPVADPNNPTSLHRIAKATIIDGLVTKYPQLMNAQNALKRMMRIADIDTEGLLNTTPAAPPPDPKMVAIQSKAQAEQMKAQIDQVRVQLEAQKQQATFVDNDKERAFKQQIQQYELQLEQMRVQAEMIIHAHDLQRDDASAKNDMQAKQAEVAHGIISDHASNQASLQQTAQKHQIEVVANAQKQHQEMVAQQQKHQQTMAAQREQHAQEIQLEREKHQADLENQKQIADAKAKAIGPAEEKRVGMEGEKHDQQMKHDDESHQQQSEKHKVDLANSKKLAAAKVKAMNKPKPKPAGGK